MKRVFKAILIRSVCASNTKPERVVIKLGACASITQACKVAADKCPFGYTVWDVSAS